MSIDSPIATIETEGEIFQEFPEELTVSVGNCCEVAKNAWVTKVKELENNLVRDTSDRIISQVLNPNHLDCKNFAKLLKELYELPRDQDPVFTVNKIVGRYFRIDKLKTSLLKHVADIAKFSSKHAIATWNYCHRNKTTDWQQQLRRDE